MTPGNCTVEVRITHDWPEDRHGVEIVLKNHGQSERVDFISFPELKTMTDQQLEAFEVKLGKLFDDTARKLFGRSERIQ